MTASVIPASSGAPRRVLNVLARGMVFGLALGRLSGPAFAAEEFFDRLREDLTWSANDGRVRARVSGLVDLEGYSTQLPAPGVLHLASESYFNPRVTTFLDAQWGLHVYAFAQARTDRGFDPGDPASHTRLDEYAIRFTPWRDGRLTVQVGKFATVVGNWMARHESWANPLITAPLPYEHLTGVWDAEPVRFSGQLLQWSHARPGLPANVVAIEKTLRIPIVWGPSYTTGVSASGGIERFRYAVEVKNAALSSRPDAWTHGDNSFEHPTVSGRLGYRPNEMWNVGVSASAGSYLRPTATLPAGRGRGDYRQLVVGQDLGFARHHFQLWSEIYAARFEIPAIGNADTLAYYTEAKYKFTPQFYGALRWNQQLFGTIRDKGVDTHWGEDLWRIDLAPAYRFTPHTQLKLQYSLQHGDSAGRSYTRLVATQFTARF